MALWTPSQIATTLWLDASDLSTITQSSNSVSEWRDKSGNSHHMLQVLSANQAKTGTRALNSLNVLDFDGSNDFMSLSSGFQAGANDSMILAVIVQDSAVARNERILNCQAGVGTRFGLFNSSAGTIFVHASSYMPVTASHQIGTNILGGVKLGGTQGVGYNGGIYTTNNNASTAPTLDGWFLGCYNGASEFFDGAIAEIIVVLSYDYDIRQKIEGYLAHKWGLTAKLPNDHPYKTEAPTDEVPPPSDYAEVATYDSARTTGSYAKNVWDLQVYDNKVYVGQGNSSNVGLDQNAGAIPIYSLNPATGLYTNEYTVDEEQIDLFKVIEEDLYVLGHDPRDSWDFGNFYRRGLLTSWEKVRTVPNGVHMYDMVYFNNELYVALGVPTNGDAIAKSSDMGQTWTVFDTETNNRMHACFEFQGDVYFAPLIKPDRTVPKYTVLNKYSNGTMTTVDSVKLIPASLQSLSFGGAGAIFKVKSGSAFTFANFLVYIIGLNFNDHQIKHTGLCKTNDLTNDATLISFPESSYVPTDAIKRDITLYVVGHIISGSNYTNIIYSTLDLVTWVEVARITKSTFAMSFEELDGDFYLGLGTYESSNIANVPADTGKIVRLSSDASLYLDLTALNIDKVLHDVDITLSDTPIDLDLTVVNTTKSIQNLDAKLSIELNLDVLNISKSLQNIGLQIPIDLDLTTLNINRNLWGMGVDVLGFGINLNLPTLNIAKSLQSSETKVSIELGLNVLDINKSISDMDALLIDRIINLNLTSLNISKDINNLSATLVIIIPTLIVKSAYDLYRRRMNSTKTDNQVFDCEIANDIKINFKQQPNYHSVHKNFDYNTSYDILFANGNVKDKSVGYKQLISYPYDTYVFNKGDYIHMTYGGESTTWLLVSLETSKLYDVKGRMEQCNNDLKWLDSNGNVQSYKCLIEDTIREDRVRDNKTVTLPDGYIVVEAQDNEHTRQIKINKRFLFNGTAWQVRSLINYSNTGIIGFVMVKDTENPEIDDLVNNIANAYQTNYNISIVQDDFEQEVGYSATLNYSLTLNNEIVTREVEWVSSDDEIGTVSSSGVINLLALGEVSFTVRMKDNVSVNDTVIVTVTDAVTTTSENLITPDISNIFQNETQVYTVHNYVNNVQTGDTFTITASQGASEDDIWQDVDIWDDNEQWGGIAPSTPKYILNIINGNSFSVKSLGYDSTKLLITCMNNTDSSVVTREINLKGLW